MLDPVIAQATERLLRRVPRCGPSGQGLPGRVEQFVFELRGRKENGR
jgi:hypothetical protein